MFFQFLFNIHLVTDNLFNELDNDRICIYNIYNIFIGLNLLDDLSFGLVREIS